MHFSPQTMATIQQPQVYRYLSLQAPPVVDTPVHIHCFTQSFQEYHLKEKLQRIKLGLGWKQKGCQPKALLQVLHHQLMNQFSGYKGTVVDQKP